VASVSQIGIPETVAKFYMSEILCALGYIHKQQLVLRDLKLENVMVDLAGHVKLIDFGLAADLPGDVMLEPQRVGTRSYFPPEIDANQPYCESVDWWCFGVTMYDLLHQEVPIKEDENGNMVYDVNNIKYAERLSKEAEDLMRKLLVVDQFKRLENAEMVRFHPFFEPSSKDWRLVEDRKIRPPWIPGNKCLTTNLFPKCFDPFFTRQKLQVRPDPKFDEGEWGNHNYHYFQEFKYIGDIE
jgi:serine/threonine protein kinase